MITIAAKCEELYPTARRRASSFASFKDVAQQNGGHAEVPRTRPRPPSIWNVERYVFSTR